jgi:hypothetical protein
MSWREVPSTQELEPGSIYRVTLYIRAPYSRFVAETLANAIRAGVGLRNLDPFRQLKEKTSIRNITWDFPSLSTHSGGRTEPWPFRIEFRKTTVNTPILVIYGLIALIAMATVAVSIAGKKFEQLIVSAGSTFDKSAEKVLNPGVVLGAFVIGTLVLTSRR